MALSKLDSLYMAVVADHSKNPHHHGKLDDTTPVHLNNPTCGDVISLSVKFDGDRIADIAFDGDGCLHLCADYNYSVFGSDFGSFVGDWRNGSDPSGHPLF